MHFDTRTGNRKGPRQQEFRYDHARSDRAGSQCVQAAATPLAIFWTASFGLGHGRRQYAFTGFVRALDPRFAQAIAGPRFSERMRPVGTGK